MPKQQRIRDPLRDIIDFNVDEVHLDASAMASCSD